MKTNKTRMMAAGLLLSAGMAAMAQGAEPVQTTQPLQSTQLEDTKSSKWSLDVSLYGLAAAQEGDVTVMGRKANLDVDFDTIWDNLDKAAMGTVRIGYGKWSLVTDLVYMKLQASASSQHLAATVDYEQLLLSPAVAYQLSKNVELLAGVNYNRLHTDIRGTFGFNPSGTQDWVDPFVGTDVGLPITESLSFHTRADIGGFGVGSRLTYQAFPYMNWRFSKWVSLQAGYRWLYVDYKDGSGNQEFHYDVTTSGPQVGITGHF